MAKKKLRLTRLQARAQETGKTPQAKASGDEDKKEKSHDEEYQDVSESLKSICDATPEEEIIGFASEKLRHIAKTKDEVYTYMIQSSTNVATLKYFQKELEEFLALKREKAQSQPIPDVPKEESNREEIPPDTSPWNPEMSDADDPVKFMVQHFKEAKQRLENMVDRLTVCENRLDIHDAEKVDVKDMEKHMASMHDIVKEITKDLLEKMPKPDAGSGDGGHGTYTIKYPDGSSKKLKEKLPACWKTLLDLATTRQNIFLAGPTQCGKTKTAEMLADALGLRFASLSCSEGLDESIYAGSLLPLGENGKFIYVPSQFVEYYENGGVYLLDEFCASDSNLGVFMNNATGNDHFYLPRRFDNPLVKRHPDFICIAADNTLGHGGDDVYVGRNQMDGSTMERFRTGFIVMDYSPAIEKSVSDPDIYEWAINIRKGIRALSMDSRHMTTRTMKQFTILKNERQWDLRKMEKIFFADWPKDDVSRLLEWIKRDLEKQLAKAGGKV